MLSVNALAWSKAERDDGERPVVWAPVFSDILNLSLEFSVT